MLKWIAFVLVVSPSCFAASAVLKVAQVHGMVRLNGNSVKVGDELPQGGVIEVDKDKTASIDIQYPEGHYLRLKAGTKLKLGGDSYQMELLLGQIYLHAIPGKNADKIRVKTRAVIAGVRGTKFTVEEYPNHSSYICVCEGQVSVTGVNDHATDGERLVKVGEDLWARPGKAMGQPISSPGMSKMTTAEFSSMP